MIQSKKILIATGIFPPDIGGPASFGRTISMALALNHKVTVISYSSVWQSKEDKNFPFKVVRVWRKTPWFLRHFIYFTKVFFAVKKSDVVFSLSALNSGIASLISAKIFRKKLFVKVVGDRAWEAAAAAGKTSLMLDDFQKSKKTGKIRLIYKFQSWVSRNADSVIVPSQYLAGIVRSWGVSPQKVHVIYNGTDFQPAGLAKEDARKKIGISGNIILSIGRLVPWKGFRMLIKIMPQLLNLNQFARLVIVGEGPDKEILEAMVRNLGLEKKVFLVGKKSKEDLAVYLAAADTFVLNSGYEGFSHQILEAMACGTPVIVSAAGGNKELVKQGENGFLVKYNDEFNITEAIKALWNDKELGEHFAEEGKKTVQKFSSGKMVQNTLALLTNSPQ